MIERIEGRLMRRSATTVVLAAGDWWLELHVPSTDPARIGADGDPIALWTHLIWKDDGPTLCGFADPAERTLFRLLLQVQGVGTRIALAMLGRLTPGELVHALRTRSAASLTAVTGVGAKLAGRILVELGPKADRSELGPEESVAEVAARTPGEDDAVRALGALGYPSREGALVVAEIRRLEPNLPLDETLRRALRHLGRGGGAIGAI